MEDMGEAASGWREAVVPEGLGEPQEVCMCAPIKRSRGEDVNLQNSKY